MDCPLCGSLRAVHDLTRLHLGAALRDNVFSVAGLPLMLGFWVLWLRRGDRGGTRPAVRRGLTVLLIIAAVAFTVLRNLPVGAALRPS